MNFSQANVRLDQIEPDDLSFKISSSTDIEALARSFAHCGLLNPPFLTERDGHLAVVCGFGRLEAARRAGWPTIRVRILSPDTAPEFCARIAIIDNSSQRELNLCEQVRAIRLLEGLVPDPGQLTDRAKACGLPVNHKVIADLRKIARLPHSLEPGLVNGAIALPTAVRLADMGDLRAAEMLGIMLIDLNVSMNRQREIIDWIEAIEHREKLDTPSILKSEALIRLHSDTQIDRRQKAALIRQYLKNRRFPAITSAEREFEALRRSLNLPPSIQLIAPPGFEGRAYSIQLQVAEVQDLVKIQTELQRLAHSSQFESLFK